ncbi:MAG: hypothetical protein JJU10_10900 [Idiomarina sp.]|nr:hypothetical protein [Idiomarina sp.]
MKKTILAAAVAALSLSTVAQADSYIAGGLYDFSNSNIFLEGRVGLENGVGVFGQYVDVLDSRVRLGVEYDLNQDVFAILGVSRYAFRGGDDTGILAGVGYRMNAEGIPLHFTATYDSALDGYLSVGGFAQYTIAENLAIDFGYVINTNSVTNEFRLGLRYSF